MTTPTTVQVQLKLRGDTAANWTSVNPTLLANELGRETDTGKIKIGDGSTAWSSLAYQFGGAGGTITGDVTLNAQSDLRFADADSSNWVAFQAPATVASNVTWTLPAADGTVGQVLSTNGSGVLSWADDTGGSSLIAETQQTISENYTLTAAYNGLSAGPVEVAATYSVTVPAGATWVII